MSVDIAAEQSRVTALFLALAQQRAWTQQTILAALSLPAAPAPPALQVAPSHDDGMSGEPMSPPVRRIMVTGRSTLRRQRRVLTPTPDAHATLRSPLAQIGEDTPSSPIAPVQLDFNDSERSTSPGAVAPADADSPPPPPLPCPSTTSTPVLATVDSSSLHNLSTCSAAQRLSFGAAAHSPMQAPPPATPLSALDSSHTASGMRASPAATPMSALNLSHTSCLDESMGPIRRTGKKKRIVVSDSEEEDSLSHSTAAAISTPASPAMSEALDDASLKSSIHRSTAAAHGVSSERTAVIVISDSDSDSDSDDDADADSEYGDSEEADEESEEEVQEHTDTSCEEEEEDDDDHISASEDDAHESTTCSSSSCSSAVSSPAPSRKQPVPASSKTPQPRRRTPAAPSPLYPSAIAEDSDDRDFIATSEEEEDDDDSYSEEASDSDTENVPPRSHSSASGAASKVCRNVSGAAFARRRTALLSEAYAELNQRIFDGQLSPDVPLIWSKTLRTTAGRCFSRQCMVLRIEMSIKVCTDEQKMRDTLVHEMCHAAVNSISRQPKAPAHGALFQQWGQRATQRMPSLGVVSRCHNYVVHKPFQWQCVTPSCRRVVGRHSDSIDVARVRCGRCGGRLDKLGKFAADGTPAKVRPPTGFALFVQQHYSSTKTRNPSTPHRDLIKVMASEYKQAKEQGTLPPPPPSVSKQPTLATIADTQAKLEEDMARLWIAGDTDEDDEGRHDPFAFRG